MKNARSSLSAQDIWRKYDGMETRIVAANPSAASV